jgi:NTP pyrophosphatase (non-canonical NTP hydrolase)
MGRMSEFEQFVESHAKIGLDDMNYNVIGLCGESGEVAEWVKKALHRKDARYTDAMLVSECGDVLHYLVRVLRCRGFCLKDAIEDNVAKISERHSQ